MQNNKLLWIGESAVTTVLAVAALIGLLVLPYCSGSIATAEGGTVPMKCYWTFHAETVVAVLVLLTAAGQFFLKGTEARRLSSLFLIAAVIAGLLLMTDAVIGLCANPAMNCHRMADFTRIVYALLIAAAVFQLVKPGITRERHKKTF